MANNPSNDAVLTIGTSGVACIVDATFHPGPQRAILTSAHAAPDTFLSMGVVMSATASLDWTARLGGTTMGTSWSVSLAVPRSRDLHPLHAGIQAQLDRVVAQMSTWEPGSDISRYNRAASGHWQALPEFNALFSVPEVS